MEVFNSFVLLLVCTSIFSVAGAWKIVNWAWFRPRKVEKMLRQQGVGGSRYKLLLGDVKEMVSSAKEAESKPIPFTNNFIPRIMPFFSNIVKNHGASSFTWMGPSPALLITNPELMKEVLAKNYVYQKPQNNPLAKLLAEGVATYDTDKWAKHRRIINPAFHLEKLKLMMPAFYLSCTEMLSKWENIASTDGSVELDVWPYFKTMTGDVISRTAFGSNFEEGRKIFELQTEQSDLFEEAIRSIYLPGFRFLPTKRNRRMKENYREVNSLVMSILNKRVKSMQEGEAVGNDLLGILMESNQKAIQEDNNNDKLGMSFEDMIQECKLFYFAGHETTAILLVWTLILLGKHTDWQARAREEVLHVLGNKKPDFEYLNQLKIVTMILNEVLRLYTPGTMTARRTGQETKLGELSLPKDMMIFLLPILMHHDPEIWGDDAEEFNPERFSEGVSKAPRKGQSTSYIPFSSGPRICVGQNFAMLEAKMAIALILQKFSFETSPLYVHAPRLMLSLLQPQFGAQLILRKL